MAKRRHAKPNRSAPTDHSRTTAVAPTPSTVNRRVGQRTRPAPSRPLTTRIGRPIPRQLIVAAIAALVVILIAGGVVAFGLYRVGNVIGVASGNSTGSDLLGVPIPDEGRVHVAEGSAITYRQNPPASGPHYPSPEPWGIYTNTIAPGYWVHDLEHGGIVVLYDCPAGCSQVVAELHQAYDTFPKDKYNEVKLVATPYSGLPNGTQVMAVAWDYQKSYSTFDLQKFQVFYSAHVDHGPEDIP